MTHGGRPCPGKYRSSDARRPAGSCAFQRAADIWGGLISSNVTIRVGADFDPLLDCNASSAILGSAGPNTVHRDFHREACAHTWYPAALANALNGSDLAPSTDDISATFQQLDRDSRLLASSAGTMVWMAIHRAAESTSSLSSCTRSATGWVS